MKTLGEKIQEARKKTLMSQKKLGLLIGVSDKTISSYENNRTKPSVEILSEIAKELQKPMGYFLDESQLTVEDRITVIKERIEELKKDISELEKTV